MPIESNNRVGATDLFLPRLGFGAAPLGGFRGKIQESEVNEILQAAFDHNVTYFDTSPYYGYGRSELRIGNFLRELPRRSYVLSTKIGRWLEPLNFNSSATDLRQGGLPFQPQFDYSAEGTFKSLEQSMMRLGISEIDILYIHDVDVFTHGSEKAADQRYEEVLRGCYPALEKLRSQGIIKAVGIGLNENERSLRFLRDTDIDCILLAGRYTLLEQESLSSLLPECIRKNVSIIIGGPFNSGVLATGLSKNAKYDYGEIPKHIALRVLALQAVCQRFEVSLIAAALQFPLAHPTVVSVIPGAMNKNEQMVNILAMKEKIPKEFWQELKTQRLIREDAPVPK
jgi:D-threo-aldose 1-dehydrogenase